MRRTRGGVVAAALLVAFVAGCGDDTDAPDDTGSPADSTDVTVPAGTEPGIANPASVYCVEQGGTVEIVDEADGQVGYCLLPDGTRVEEWEYFREQTGGTGP